jgi:hypothetical protein
LECEAGLVFNLGTEYGAFSLSLGYSMLNPAADMYGEIQFGIGFYFGL